MGEPFIAGSEIEEGKKRGFTGIKIGREKHANKGLNETGSSEVRARLGGRFTGEVPQIFSSFDMGMEVAMDEPLRNLEDEKLLPVIGVGDL